MFRTVAVFLIVVSLSGQSILAQSCLRSCPQCQGASANDAVQALYYQLLQRKTPPTQEEMHYWVGNLENGCMTVHDVVLGIATGAEFEGQFTMSTQPEERSHEIYRRLLARDVTDQANIDKRNDQLKSSSGVRGVVLEILTSSEYECTYGEYIVPQQPRKLEFHSSQNCPVTHSADNPQLQQNNPQKQNNPQNPNPNPGCRVPPNPTFACKLGTRPLEPLIVGDSGCGIAGCAKGFHSVCVGPTCDWQNATAKLSACGCVPGNP